MALTVRCLPFSLSPTLLLVLWNFFPKISPAYPHKVLFTIFNISWTINEKAFPSFIFFCTEVFQNILAILCPLCTFTNTLYFSVKFIADPIAQFFWSEIYWEIQLWLSLISSIPLEMHYYCTADMMQDQLGRI